MFRTVLAIATATLGLTACATTAQACISCEYVPEVVRDHSTFNAKKHRAPAYVAVRQRVRPPVPVVKVAPRRIETASISAPKTAKADSVEKTSKEATKTAPASLALLKTETVSEAPAEAAKPVIETASTTVPAVETAEPAGVTASEKVGCKRFIPAVGVTLSVACD